MPTPKNLSSYIPLDKSWATRLGVLDVVHGTEGALETLRQHPGELCDDLQFLLLAAEDWREGNTEVRIGESGTLYRFLQFAAWYTHRKTSFIKEGTLRTRAITDDPAIAQLPLANLLQLDGGTSQWASAAVLIRGDVVKKGEEVPYKLQVTLEALLEYEDASTQKRAPVLRRDATIAAQAATYLAWLKDGTLDFRLTQAEDYCFARAFELISPETGERRWPALGNHESDRIAAMETVLSQAARNQVVISDDHRVVQAVAMRHKLSPARFSNPEAVNKSWPQFWQFLAAATAT